jgi:hypothetical protein
MQELRDEIGKIDRLYQPVHVRADLRFGDVAGDLSEIARELPASQ